VKGEAFRDLLKSVRQAGRIRGRTVSKTSSSPLEAYGWRVAAAKDFLELTSEESALVETKLALSRTLRTRRVAQLRSTPAAVGRRL
jgi:hypothetical protein